MNKKYDFEYIVIGSGPAGSAAAINLARAKKRVALIESHAFGGANINTRDVPYDIALNFANLHAKLLSTPEFRQQDFSFNFSSNVSHQLRVSTSLSQNHKKYCEAAGVICLNGYANLLDKHTIALGKQKLTAKSFILATGSRLKASDITIGNTAKYYTPETAIKIRRRPRAVLIAGGGPTGCEIATYFAELGVKVILMEAGPHLLPNEDKEIGDVVTHRLTSQFGAMILPSCKVVAIERDGSVNRVIFRHARSEKMVRVDCVILATGSEPVLDYGLENAGIKYTPAGIPTDKFFCTSTKNIYAIGDARGQLSSTEIADYEGSILASNLLGKNKNIANYSGFVRSVKTNPEVAIIGLSEGELIRRKRKYQKSIVHFNELPASQIYDCASDSFVKLLVDRNRHILGACVVAPKANLLAEELSIIIRHNLSILELASTPHFLNDYNCIVKLAAKKLTEKKR